MVELTVEISANRLKEFKKKVSATSKTLASLAGVTEQAFSGYLKAKNLPAAPALSRLSEHARLNINWFLTGNGPILIDEKTSEPPRNEALAAIGFASCGINGWAGKMTHATVVTAPHLWPDMFCVIASGESMIPEGIGHGHYVFCAPNLPPVAGECVYVETTDGKGALKRFLGEKDIKGTGAGIHLLGWLDRNSKGQQKSFEITISKELVKTLAPVVYIQRRV